MYKRKTEQHKGRGITVKQAYLNLYEAITFKQPIRDLTATDKKTRYDALMYILESSDSLFPPNAVLMDTFRNMNNSEATAIFSTRSVKEILCIYQQARKRIREGSGTSEPFDVEKLLKIKAKSRCRTIDKEKLKQRLQWMIGHTTEECVKKFNRSVSTLTHFARGNGLKLSKKKNGIWVKDDTTGE